MLKIKLTKNILSKYRSKVMYDVVQLHNYISMKEKKVSLDIFLSLLPKNAMHLSKFIQGEFVNEFQMQRVLAVLGCHNPSHSLALLFVEYLKSPFLKKDLVIAGTYSLAQLQATINRAITSEGDCAIIEEIVDNKKNDNLALALLTE